jgi:hypothetical protein
MKELLGYALTLPISSAVIGCDDLAQLEAAVQLAQAWRPLDPAQMAALDERARPLARQALFFRPWP